MRNKNWLFWFQVRDLVEKCTCPSQFPMVRVSEGKYRIGDTKVLIFVRVSTVSFFIQMDFFIIFIDYNKNVLFFANGSGMVIKLFLLILKIWMVISNDSFGLPFIEEISIKIANWLKLLFKKMKICLWNNNGSPTSQILIRMTIKRRNRSNEKGVYVCNILAVNFYSKTSRHACCERIVCASSCKIKSSVR